MKRFGMPWASDRRAQVLLLPPVLGQSVYLLLDLQNTLYSKLLGVLGWSAFIAYWVLAARDRRRAAARPPRPRPSYPPNG